MAFITMNQQDEFEAHTDQLNQAAPKAILQGICC